jgi:hypothetical protein
MEIEYVNKEQLDNIWGKMNDYNIPLDCIKNLLNVKYMSDMTVQQYNYLLLIIYQVENKWNDYD